jgi:hypothetical protein
MQHAKHTTHHKHIQQNTTHTHSQRGAEGFQQSNAVLQAIPLRKMEMGQSQRGEKVRHYFKKQARFGGAQLLISAIWKAKDPGTRPVWAKAQDPI